MRCNRSEREEILRPVHIEHSIEGRPFETAPGTVNRSKSRETRERNLARSDADDGTVLCVQSVDGAGAGAAVVGEGETPFCECVEGGTGDVVEDEQVLKGVVGDEKEERE